MLKRKNAALQLGQFLALVASLLIAGQIGYTYYQGAPLCLNEGCKVVDQLTRVSPLVINFLGLAFFLVVYVGLRLAKGETRRVAPFVKNLLLAGLAVEGVLVAFQGLVANTFCFYCLGVLGFVVLLNLLLGGRQILAGVMIFTASTLAFAGLELGGNTSGKQAFVDGVFAQRLGQQAKPEHYLFFSSTCPHCEKVIASLKGNTSVSIAFNPIDKVTAIDLPQVSYSPRYSAAMNKSLLGSLGINEIPVLMTKTAEGWLIRQGEAAVLAALAQPATATPPASGQSTLVPNLPGGSDGCQVSADCTNGSSGQSFLR